jgi:hypothetical protein
VTVLPGKEYAAGFPHEPSPRARTSPWALVALSAVCGLLIAQGVRRGPQRAGVRAPGRLRARGRLAALGAGGAGAGTPERRRAQVVLVMTMVLAALMALTWLVAVFTTA